MYVFVCAYVRVFVCAYVRVCCRWFHLPCHAGSSSWRGGTLFDVSFFSLPFSFSSRGGATAAGQCVYVCIFVVVWFD